MFQMVFYGVALPLAFGGAGVAAALWLHARERSSLAAGVLALGVGLGAALAQPGISGSFTFPPVSAPSWFFFFAIVAALTAMAQTWADRSEVGLILAGSVGAWLAATLLAPRVEYAWGAGEALLWSAGVAFALPLVFGSCERIRKVAPPSALAAALAGWSGALAVTLIFSGTALVGQLSGALACALTLPFFASFSKSARAWVGGLALPTATLFVTLISAGYFFAEMPLLAALVALAGPVVAALAAPLLFERLGKVPAWIVFQLVAIAPALIALAIAFVNYEAPSDYY